jgi:cytochrome c-type biogenesis protein CcmF
MITFFAILGFGLLIMRLKEIPRQQVHHNYWSREFALFLGSSALVCTAIFITIGTSSPLITGLFQGKTSAVDTSYYVTTTVPLGIIIGLLAGTGQLLWWTRSDRTLVLKSLIYPSLVAVLTTLVLILFGVRHVLVGLLVFGAAFALTANLQVALKIFRGNPKYAGGSIAHIGLAILFLGFIASSKYDDKQTLSLVEGEPVEALGYKLTYAGYAPIDKEKYAFHVRVEKGEHKSTVSPVMYYSEYTKGLMRNPDILNLITKDFYIAPMSLEQKSDEEKANQKKVQLKRGETKQIGDIQVTFVDFDFPVMEKAAMLEGKDVRIGAKLAVSEYGKKPTIVVPTKIISKGESTNRPASYAGRYEFTIVGMRPDREAKENSTVEVGISNLTRTASSTTDQRDILVVEASVKPYINLVWAGVIVVLLGFFVTIVRRMQEASQRG